MQQEKHTPKRRSERWKRRQKHSRLFLLIYLVICVLIFLLVWKIMDYRKGLVSASRYRAELVSTAQIVEEDKRNARNTKERGLLSGTLIDAEIEAEEETETEVPDGIDFAALKAINPDVCGWLVLPGTEFSEVIVQGQDNEKYLHELLDGTKNPSGTLFEDYRNSADFTDPMTMIYGHNMKDGSMFGDLLSFRDAKYLEEHPKFLLYTPQGTYTLRVLSTLTTDAWDTVYDLENRFGEDGPLVLLSTCSYETQEGRFVVVTRRELSEETG